MYKKRIIARLDIKTHNVVKGIRFEGLRVMGLPHVLANEYYHQGADELIYIDTVASLYGRDNIIGIVRQAAESIFIPMTVGGGIRSVDDARQLLHSGADKIAVNTAAVARPKLITELAEAFGTQAVVASLQIKKLNTNRWEIYVENGRNKTGVDALEWIKEVERLGAGEILITSVDFDGTGLGPDMKFIESIQKIVKIPMILGGGIGTIEHAGVALRDKNINAVAIASMLHYKKHTINEIKSYLEDIGISTPSHS